jgi:hypothetical protein
MSEQLKKIGIRTKEGANVEKVLYRLGNKDIWMFDWSKAKLKSKREPFRCILTNKLDDPKMFYSFLSKEEAFPNVSVLKSHADKLSIEGTILLIKSEWDFVNNNEIIKRWSPFIIQ